MIENVCENIWVCRRDLKLAGVPFGTRMTVIRLQDGRLIIHSPVAIDDAEASELEALGEVSWIVAPNLFHHLFIEAFRARFPEAALVAPEDLKKKQPGAKIDHVLSEDFAVTWGDEIAAVKIDGMPKVQEHVLLHRASRTLIICDYFFNFSRPASAWARFFLWMSAALGGPRQSRLFRFMIKDRAAFSASNDRVLALDFDRVLLPHGELIETGGKAAIQNALSWMGGKAQLSGRSSAKETAQ